MALSPTRGALSHSEREGLGSHNAVELLMRAARAVYTSAKYQRRGELGEILLHVALRQVFRTVPAISKVFFKDSSNDTVKGFDAVHVVISENALELWLGETKFYEAIDKAIYDVVRELSAHTQRDYLRTEFSAIINKIDPAWPPAERLKLLLDKNTSLDRIFDAVCIPVLLTYDSPTVSSFTSVSSEYKEAIEREVLEHWETFAGNNLPDRVRIHLILLPCLSKQELAAAFDERLKRWQ